MTAPAASAPLPLQPAWVAERAHLIRRAARLAVPRLRQERPHVRASELHDPRPERRDQDIGEIVR